MKSSARQAFVAPYPFLRAAIRYMQDRYGSYRPMEVIYRELFVRELHRLGIEDRFFPVGAAANHGLLYLVLRCFVELPMQRVLDVGAGQTSLLLDALNRKLGKAEIITLEHDPAWAERIAGQVAHQVLRRDLIEQRIGGHATRMHDTTALEGPFQLIIMDAPPGVPRYSRLGLLHLMQTRMDRKDFVAILDDADPSGGAPDHAGVPTLAQGRGPALPPCADTRRKAQWFCAGGALESAAFF